VQAQFTRIPTERYTMLVTFRSDPDRIDELTDRVFDVLEEVRSTTPEDTYVERIQETQRASFREQLTSNQFWVSQLAFVVRNDRPISAIRRYLDLVDALSATDIREAAEAYLDLGSYVQVTLLPAESE